MRYVPGGSTCRWMPCSPVSANRRPAGRGLPPVAVTMPTLPGGMTVFFSISARIDDRHDKVPAFAEHLALDALLPGLGQHLSRRQRLAVLGDDHQVLARRHVDKEFVPGEDH